jgi:hypothetical protein
MSAKCAGCKARDKKIEGYVSRLDKLNSDLKQAKKRIARFRIKVSNIHQGLKFEERILKLIKGTQGAPGGPYDIIAGKRKKVEVKFSELNSPNGTTCKRWDWHSLYGHNGKNKWDYLILGGKKDPRFKNIYKDKRSSNVYFLLTWKETKQVKQPGSKAGHIAVTTNVDKMHANNQRGKLLWQYETTEKGLKRFFARK